MKVRTETAMPASDRLSTFIAAGAWAAIVGGAAMIISLLLDWLVVPYEKLGVAGAYLTASYPVSSGLRLLGTVLFLWALIALYNRQSIAVGTFGLWSFVVAFFGTARQIQSVEAFASTSSANISEGFFQSWILRGRSLISEATIAK